MKKKPTPEDAEKLFPFVLRARKLIVGRENLFRKKGRLHFVLITTDISDNSREEILKGFSDYPVVQRYASADLERLFAVHNTKVVGFEKSTLSASIYQGLREARINRPEQKKDSAPAPEKGS
jgi:hypothetical protein